MTLSERIAVRYTEDEAEYVSLRPIVRQSFRIDELVDMILSVTGKDSARIRQILKSGSVAYHGYRYWWTGFDAADEDISKLLAHFPDADASRQFIFDDCLAFVIESSGTPPRHSVEIAKVVASRRGVFRLHTFWEELKTITNAKTPIYRDYSYARHADIFMSALAPDEAAQLDIAAKRRLPRSLHASLAFLPEATRLLWICSRRSQ